MNIYVVDICIELQRKLDKVTLTWFGVPSQIYDLQSKSQYVYSSRY